MTDPTARAGRWRPTSIPGVQRASLTLHPDERGSFTELWRDTWADELPGVSGPLRVRQANISRSRPRVLRGLHVHRRQVDVWVLLEGRAFVGLVDVRDALGGHGGLRSEGLEASAGDVFYLPEGVAHGFYAREALTLVYFVTNEYDGTDELGFAWDDPAAGVSWPDPAPILSARDASAPLLSELLDRLRAAPA